MQEFHPEFNENDKSTFAYPIKHDAELYTLDVDGK